ncbi:MAG: gamma-glutamyltransferase, partial [Perlucidibaca sp.]
MTRLSRLVLAACLLASTPAQADMATSTTLQAIAQRQATPEAGSGRYPLSTASARHAMVVTAHPLATEAALSMLRAGGSAADAAVAAEAVLGLVEPQSSGFGGGGFLIHANRDGVTAIDGRETAPAATNERRFLDSDGRPLSFDAALESGLAVGVPGTVAMLAEAHRRWGRLPWATLLQPAIRLAEQGAPVSHRLSLLSGQDRMLSAHPATRAFFLDADGKPWPPGHLLRYPEQARLLRLLARKGPQAFYRGTLAASMVDQLRAAGSDISLADWQGYRARVSPALCRPVSRWRVCTPPQPAGGLSVMENLGLWLDAEAGRPALAGSDLPADSLHRLLEAERLAFADRQRYSADPAVTPVPVDGLLDAG